MIFDLAVLGLGAVGSSALNYASKNGLKVIGLDQNSPPHELGSSHGETRAFRKAYFEHDGYVPLLKESYKMWKEFDSMSRETIFSETGVIVFGEPDGMLVTGMKKSANLHNLSIRDLSTKEVPKIYPYFTAPKNFDVLFEEQAGVLHIENIISENLALARAGGAVFSLNTTVNKWISNDQGIDIICKNGIIKANRLVICAGPWSRDILSDLSLNLKLRLKHLHWIKNTDRRMHIKEGCPVFCFENKKRIFYGFPEISGSRIKVAQHTGGTELSTPNKKPTLIENDELIEIETLAKEHILGTDFKTVSHSTCIYTMSPDENFIVDNHPEDNRIAFAAGLSGHGFKFSNILGKILCDLTTQNGTELPIDFLRLKRFS